MTGHGTRQVSSLSPILINIYSEAMLRDALSGVNEGIRVGGHLIKTLRFADDQATLANSVKGLQLMMGKMQESAGEYDMKSNVKKTKVKKICKRPGEEFTIFLEGKELRANPCKNRPKSPIRGKAQKIKIALLLQTGRH